MNRVTLRQLRVFAAVAHESSFVRAAESLHLTAPAISMQIKELEASVGLPLFTRNGRQVALTTAGEYFLVYSRRILGTLKEAGDAMARLSRLETGQLTVGMVSTAKYFVPRLLGRFREEHRGIDVRLQVAQNRAQMFSYLGSNDIDVAIMGRPPLDFTARAEPFAAHPFVFIAAYDHPLRSASVIAPTSLNGLDFLAREQASGTRDTLDVFIREQRIAPRTIIEISSNEAIKQAVIAGIGIAFISLHTIGLELDNKLLRILPVTGTPIMRVWYAVTMSNRVLSPAAEAFRYFMLENAEDWLARHDARWLEPAEQAARAITFAKRGVTGEARHRLSPPVVDDIASLLPTDRGDVDAADSKRAPR